MSTYVIQPSFSAGEIAPALHARVDLEKYHSGAALLRNWFVDYRGGVSTRPGSMFVGRCKANSGGQPRLIDFIVATTNAYVLEFGDRYVRFIASGAYVTDPPTVISGVTNANPGIVHDVAHGYSTDDEVLITDVNGMIQLNGNNYFVDVIDADHYSLTDLDGNPINTITYFPYTSGGLASRVVTVTSPYAVADLPLLKYTQSADVLTLTHPLYPIYNLTQVSTGVFSLIEDVIAPMIAPPGIVAPVYLNGTDSKSLYGYVITAVSASGEESLPCFPNFCQGSILDQNTNKIISITWADSPDSPSYYNIYKVGPTASGNTDTGSPVSTVYGYIGQSSSATFIDNNIAPDFSHTPPQYQDPFSPGEIASVKVTSPGSGYTASNYIIALIFTGDGTGAAGYGIIDPDTSTIVGAVLLNAGKNYTTCVVSDANGTATYSVTLGQQSGTYPSCVGYFQQRRVFGGTLNLPEAFVASQTGFYNNFNVNPILLPNDAITASVASRQVNAIKSLTAMNTGMVVLTTGGGFLVSGGSGGSAITPNDIVALPQASSGCNDLPPLVINYDILYGQNRGNTIRDLAFNFYVQSFTGTDRSVLASNLFTGYSLTEWTFAEEPYRLVQAVRNDGALLNFTYVPEQEIFAWTHYDTNGLYKSIASIPEGQENSVYTIVQRYIGGQWVYYVEQFASRVFDGAENSWCLDCALAAPLYFPNGTLIPSAATGDITLACTAAVFSVANIGDIIWAGTGQAVITGNTNPNLCSATVIKPFAFLPNDPDVTPVPYAPGQWNMNTPITAISGLEYLEGKVVWAQVDGAPYGPFTVSNGEINLPTPGTKIVVGLLFQCQMQTLRLDTGEPTIQARRKLINAVTIRVNQTLGLKSGQSFAKLVEMKFWYGPYVFGTNLISGDVHTNLPAWWSAEGQTCFQQDLPLPATILGIIPEVTIGDTAK